MTTINPPDESLADLENIKVTYDAKIGALTITGVSYRDMRSILCQASLHQHDNRFKPVYIDPDNPLLEVVKANAEENQAWHWQMQDLVKILDGRIVQAGTGSANSDQSVASERQYRKSWRQYSPAWTHDPEQKSKPRVPSTREQIRAACDRAAAELYKLVPEGE